MTRHNLDPHDITLGFLEHFGYAPEKIAEDPTRKTPDFRCETEDATFVLELKTRDEDSNEESKRRPILESGQVYGFSQRVGRRNTVSGLVTQAVEQLAAHQEPDVFRLVCLYTGTQRIEMRRHQFKASLYGMESLMSLGRSNVLHCLYFTDSDFFRHRLVLDGALVIEPTAFGFDASLFLNNFAPRYGLLSTCTFPLKFGNGLFLPHERETPESMLIADCDVDRRDTAAVISYLCNKYELTHLQPMSMGYHEGTVLADDSDED